MSQNQCFGVNSKIKNSCLCFMKTEKFELQGFNWLPVMTH